MLKNILKLDGAQKLSKNEQKSINGGITQAMAQCMAENGCVMGAHPSNWVNGCGAKTIWCPPLV